MPKKSLIIRTSNILKEIGMPVNLLGYRYLLEIIPSVVDNSYMLSTKITSIYRDIGIRFNTAPSNVERSIRNAIEISFLYGDPSIIKKYFGYSFSSEKGRPTNKAFIMTIADYLYIGQDFAELQRG